MKDKEFLELVEEMEKEDLKSALTFVQDKLKEGKPDLLEIIKNPHDEEIYARGVTHGRITERIIIKSKEVK